MRSPEWYNEDRGQEAAYEIRGRGVASRRMPTNFNVKTVHHTCDEFSRLQDAVQNSKSQTLCGAR